MRAFISSSIIVLVLSFTAPLAAGPLEEVIAARDRGDQLTALRLVRPLAEQGNAEAQLLLGQMLPWFESGQRKWFHFAAMQGNAEAQYRFAVSYEQEWEGPKDYAVAAKWYRRAAEQGNGLASESLGHLYSRGDGVPKDYVEAMKWYRLAVDQGVFFDALVSIGLLYDRGEGVPQDGAEAMKWYRRSLDHGDQNAKILIGYLYLHGNGVPQDYVMAHMWFSLAAATGDHHARGERDEVEKLMTAAQITEAQELARESGPSREVPE